MTNYLPGHEDENNMNILVEMALQKVEESNIRYLDTYAIIDIAQSVWKEQILANVTDEQLSSVLEDGDNFLLDDPMWMGIAQEIRKRLNAWNN